MPQRADEVRLDGYKTAREIALKVHDALEDKLCEPMKEELDAFLSKDSAATSMYATQSFIDGFKLGAKLMLEILEVSEEA